MGWISWARFACEIDCKQYPKQCINEELYKNMIDRIASDGYLEAGYRYVNIDDCWMDKHRDLMTQQLLADRKRFPSGIAWLAKYAHQKNVLFGIYEDAGTLTCAGLPGTFSENIDHTKIDVKTFTSWGIDAVKMDGCYAKNLPYNQTYPSYSQTLKKSGHDFLFECSWPAYIQNVTDEEYELIKKNCHYWRNFDDITDSWSSVLSIIDFYGQNNDQFRKFHGPGGWFDPDMLIIGNNGLSYEQSKAQMAFWCMWSAPLFMSNDLRTIRPELKEILLNKELIAINQDPLGLMAKLINKQPKKKFEIWIKKLAPLRKNGLNPFAVLYFYYGTLGPDKYLSMKLSDMIPNSSNSTYTYNCYDLYQNYKHLATLKSNEQLRLLVPMGGAVRLVKLVPVTKS